MFSFPEQLVVRMKAAIPQRERSKVLASLLENEISKRERSLYLRAQALEKNEGLKEEMETWDNEFGQDGLENVSNNKSAFTYQRGEVYLVEEHQVQGHEQKKTRPWVLIGATPINRARSTLVAVPLSTQAKEIEGLCIKVYVNNSMVCAVLDQIRALDKKRFIRFEGVLSSHEISLIDDGLRQVLAL